MEHREAPVRDLNMLEQSMITPLKHVIKSGYFSLEVQGAHLVPTSGQVLYISNHAGWIAIDNLMQGFAIWEHIGPERLPYIFAHEVIARFKPFQEIMQHSGILPVSWLHEMERLPEDIETLALMPEGADGNSKPFWHAYRMMDWHTGFVRLAIERKAKVIPIATIGAEECAPVLYTIDFLKPFLGSVAPLPMFPVPLPSKWKVIFHEPLDFSKYDKSIMSDHDKCHDIAQEVREIVQTTLDKETLFRPLAWVSRFAHQVLKWD